MGDRGKRRAERKSGRELEDLVADMERHLLPHGFTVAVRRTEREDGRPIAEFDVEISGPVGSSSVRWLLSCRDRPSSGPAPADWIEQLDGRRRRFHYDKVFAVSTTGFSAPAVHYAEQAAIILRTVSKIQDIDQEFSFMHIENLIFRLEVAGPIAMEAPVPIPEEILREVDPDLRAAGRGNYLPWRDFIQRTLEAQDAPLPEPRQSRQYVVDIRVPVEARFGTRVFLLTRLHMRVEITCRAMEAECLVARRYEEGGRLIGKEGVFATDLGDGRRIVRRLIATDNGDGTYTPRLIPIDLPEGIVPMDATIRRRPWAGAT